MLLLLVFVVLLCIGVGAELDEKNPKKVNIEDLFFEVNISLIVSQLKLSLLLILL